MIMDRNYLIQLTSRLYNLTLLFPRKDPLRFKIRDLGTEILASSVLIFADDFENSEEMSSKIKKDIEVLNCFFEVVKNLNWVNKFKILDIQDEYSKIEKKFGEVFSESQKQLKFEEPASEDSEIETAEGDPLQALQMSENRLPDVKDSPTSRVLTDIENSIKNHEGKSEESSLRGPFSDDFLPERKSKILEVLGKLGRAQVGDLKNVFPDISKRTLRRDFNYLIDAGLVERKGEKNDTYYQLISRTY